MKKKISWGVVGTGWISQMFANTMRVVEDSEVIGVVDVKQELSEKYAKEHGLKFCFDSPEKLMECDEIDAIFVGTPHCFHKQYVLQALEYGKHVLCAKPFTLEAEDVKEIMEKAKEKKLLAMEAMWCRFRPEMAEIKETIRQGLIGEIKVIQIDCRDVAVYDPHSRLFDKKLGGGSLLDVGIYAVNLASFFMDGAVPDIQALADIGPTGTDHSTAMVFRYENGALGLLSCSSLTDSRQEILLVGTKGKIRMTNFWRTNEYELLLCGEEPKVLKAPAAKSDQVEKHEYMIESFNACIREGVLDNAVMPLAESYGIMQQIDKIKEEIGLSYR